MSGACEVMYCCCQPDCVSTNILCHGSAPGTIRIVGSSSYSRTLKYDFGSGLETYLTVTGSIDVDFFGNYPSPQGVGGLGLHPIYGTVTTSITQNYVQAGYWIHFADSTIVSDPPQQIGQYGCGSIDSNPGIYTLRRQTDSSGGDNTYPAIWQINGKFCSLCLNPALPCTGFMITNDPIAVQDGQVVFAFQGTESYQSPPNPSASDSSSTTGTMTVDVV